MLVTLIVNSACQADFTRVWSDGEEAAGVDEKAVAELLLLEGRSRHRDEATMEDITAAFSAAKASGWNLQSLFHKMFQKSWTCKTTANVS